MWYLVKCFLKVQIDKIYCFIVVGVIFIYDLGKEIEQACQAASFVSKPCWELPTRLFTSKCVISLPLTNLSMVLQTTRVRLVGM